MNIWFLFRCMYHSNHMSKIKGYARDSKKLALKRKWIKHGEWKRVAHAWPSKEYLKLIYPKNKKKC